MSRADFPHRHTFYEIVYVRGGRGRHVVDMQRWPLDPPHLGFVAPGQVQAPNNPVLTTRLYFPGEPRNNTDPIFNPALLMNVRTAGSEWEGTFDFALSTGQNRTNPSGGT